MSLDRQEHDATERALGRLRRELSPSSADKDRLRHALGLGTSAPAPLGGTTAPARVAAPARLPQPVRLTERAALLASGKLGASLAAILFAAGVAVGWSLQRVTPAAPAALPAAPAAASATPLAAPAGPAPVAPPAAVQQAPRGVPAPAAGPSRADPGPRRPRPRALVEAAPKFERPLDAELALLRRVERALRGNDPALAVALLDELDARFPRTRLAEERLAARTMADCRLGAPDAVARARAFLRARPSSVYSERVQLACALETTSLAAPH